jgi:CHAT domain-containing protein
MMDKLLEECFASVPVLELARHPERLAAVSHDCLPLAMNGRPRVQIEEIQAIHAQICLPPREEELPQRIQLCLRGLHLLRRDDNPELWAMFQGKLGNYLFLTPHGNRTRNLEESIAATKTALSVYSVDAYPLQWASAQTNLGTLYMHRLLSDPVENLEFAINCQKRALTVFDRQTYEVQWATTQHKLGDAYLSLGTRKERAENIEHAIACFQSALTVITLETSPKEWSEVQHNLGVAHYERSHGERASNIEEAIRAYKDALKVRRRDTLPHQWVLSQMDLGNAYTARRRGDRGENLELAIEAYEDALTVCKTEGYTRDGARLLCNLSSVYTIRSRGTPEENVERAIAAGEAALTELTQENDGGDWGRAKHNLGIAYSRRRTGDSAENTERAIQAFQAALTVRTRDMSPVNWAMTQEGLANSFADRQRGDHAENIELAIRTLKSALVIEVREADPQLYTGLQLNLGTLYRDRIRGQREENLPKAIQCFKAALELSLRYEFREEAQTTALRLADIYGESMQWEQAYSALVTAQGITERGYAAALSEEGKLAQASSNSIFYERLVNACLHVDPPRRREAFLYAEEGRSRVLRDQLARLSLPPPPGAPANLIAQETELLRARRNFENAIRTAPDEITRRQRVDDAEAACEELERVWDLLLQSPETTAYVALRRGEKPDWEHVRRWLGAQGKQVALLEFFMLRDCFIAFVIREDDDEPRVATLSLSSQELLEYSQLWIDQVFTFQPHKSKVQTWQELAPRLLTLVMPYLEEAVLVYVIPHGLLHYLPLHALEHERKPLLDYFAMVYAPSASVAMRAAQLANARGATSAHSLVVGNPSGDLPFAQAEAELIAKQLGVQSLLNGDATKARVLSALGDTTQAHLATHAYSDLSNPFASGIVLAGGETLTAKEAMDWIFNLRLLVLSGCETGVQYIGLGDELIGLARAFLYGGVPSLIMALWPVNDLSTMLLMERFYDGHRSGMILPKALREAQLWLRVVTAGELAARFDTERRKPAEELVMSSELVSAAWRRFISAPPEFRPFDHPHYWAPFLCFGT